MIVRVRIRCSAEATTAPEVHDVTKLATKWWMKAACALLLLAGHSHVALAGPSWQTGKITNMTIAGEYVMIMLDAGPPDNCVGTAYGWMTISPVYKSMQAFVLALWARGDMASVTVTVYTGGLVSGYCQVTQLDPGEG